MQTVKKELEAYESIIQNLVALKEEAIETKPKEAESIGIMLHTLSDLRNCMRGPDLPAAPIVHQAQVACPK